MKEAVWVLHERWEYKDSPVYSPPSKVVWVDKEDAVDVLEKAAERVRDFYQKKDGHAHLSKTPNRRWVQVQVDHGNGPYYSTIYESSIEKCDVVKTETLSLKGCDE